MGARGARHGLALLVVIAGVMVASSPWLGTAPALLTVALLATMPLAEITSRTSSTPEYWIAAHWGTLVLAGAAAVYATGGVRSPVLLWSVMFVPLLAARFPPRVVIIGAAAAAVAFVAAAFLGDLHAAIENPTALFFTIGAATVVSTVTVMMTSSDRDSRVEAAIDPLTGLLNRASLDLRFDELSAQARLTGGGICMVLCDVDHFKQINDNFGHDQGDEVLRSVAAEVRNSLRQFELAYRIGGEEFLILLPGIGVEEATEIAGRIRTRVAAAEPGGVNVTISCGVVGAAGGGSDFETMFRAADGALYEAKHQGRNRVVVASSITTPLLRRPPLERRSA